MTTENSNNNPQESGPGSDSESEDVFHDARFTAEEEARLVKESHEIKEEANKLFAAACYDQAISCYERALASCPNYLDYEVSVIRSNMAACYLKLEDWKAAVDSATACLDRLEKIMPLSPQQNPDREQEKQNSPSSDSVVEISGEDEKAWEEQLKCLEEMDKRKTDVIRIQAKALMRRARAKSQLGGWANLQGAEEDYKVVAGMGILPADDKRVVQRALRELPARINEAREKEMADMMGKLKDLGNGILKPFGLSTDNFKFVQDPKTGGYSMNFQS
ncbi:hypothetical protein CNMCM6106_008988 [Aspergillus hiratsukae]|uniref:Tetratricopeptide repeat protein 1 n=1 Tax=Aspergillus hiratsukae TaxID=1194566 RepID=A0A8H6PX82_9EURO|nr:hypothetical protein CNMCM6106_008988 [Aspergillus hiratsukae]